MEVESLVENVFERIRKKAGMTQQEISNKLNVDQSVYSDLERFNKKKVHERVLKNLHKVGYSSQQVRNIYKNEYLKNTRGLNKAEWLESLLYNYDELKKYVNDYHSGCIDNELGNMSYDYGQAKPVKDFSSVVETALINYYNKDPDEKGILKSIEKTLKQVNDKIFNFYYVRYKKRMDRTEVQNKLDISRRTFYRRKKYLLEKLENNIKD